MTRLLRHCLYSLRRPVPPKNWVTPYRVRCNPAATLYRVPSSSSNDIPPLKFRRSLSAASSSGEENNNGILKDKKEASSDTTSIIARQQLLDSSVRGVGQVIFLDSSRCGFIILASLVVGDPYLALLAATGAAASTFASHRVLAGQSNDSNKSLSLLSKGLLSYNGCLVGCAAAVFVAPLDYNSLSPLTVATAATVTTVGATAATAVTLSLSNMLTRMPQWTYAFNIVTLTILLRLQPFRPGDASATAEAAATPVVTAMHSSSLDLFVAPLKGLSQIFVVESPLTGMGILAAIASFSPQLAAHAILGSTIGTCAGWIVSAPHDDLAAGLWGFNSALTSMGVAVFFVNTRASIALSAVGALATAGCFGALQTVVGLAYIPCLTLPFCLTMSGCYHLAGTIPDLRLARDPHSPELNQQ